MDRPLVGESGSGLKKAKPAKKSGKQTKRFRWGRLAGGLFLAAAVTSAGAVGAGWWRYTMPGPLPEATALVIPHGGYASTIAALQQGQALSTDAVDTFVFRAAIPLTHREGQLHAAELLFPAHASMRDILSVLRHGRPVLHPLTIPEGLTASQILTIISAAPFLKGTAEELGEGEVLPETYRYLRDTDRVALTERMKHAMRREVDAIWQGRDQTIPLTDPAQLVTLASIVEKETGLPDERPHIARVFLNRLKLGMKLQSDPTTIFALNNGAGALGRPLTHSDLMTPSPYNTYMVTGLPPGPICSPGGAALQAVAHPAPGDDLYFVATGNGGHNFAGSLDEHNRNVAALRKMQDGVSGGAPSP
ncbi:endolytic transglycosylase MltG [Acetobacter conturbans]|uniref:Endolytic murein transglycosylase n=1 Tax=Acetobacter conturbans TaxID=1737472 RepID=A0ABX0JZZ7_9PROT|nr:endolytic transglycosylase MltG [Acetobacter conturbans]NHN87648.1 endolytic transglycosylase MltG [Acetobacter conturbans]